MTPAWRSRRTRSAAALALRPTSAPRSRQDRRPSSRRSLRISLSIRSRATIGAVSRRCVLRACSVADIPRPCTLSRSDSGSGSWSRCSSARCRCSSCARRCAPAGRSGWRSAPASPSSTRVYAAAGAAGAASLLAIDGLRTAFSLLGAAVLLVLGARTLRDAIRDASAEAARRRGRLAAPRVRDVGRRHRLQPRHDRLVGRDLRRRERRGRTSPCCWSPASAWAASAGSRCSPAARRRPGARSAPARSGLADAVAGAGLIAFGVGACVAL